MKNRMVILIALAFSMNSFSNSFSPSWVEGAPIAIQKSDLSGVNAIFIQMDSPVETSANCTSYGGVVVEDSNDSSEAALTFALTAFASGKKFSCYINEDNCSRVTGSMATFPVCSHYPKIKN